MNTFGESKIARLCESISPNSKREQQQAAAHERRLTKMRDEFEKKLAHLMNKRDELKTQLRMLRQQSQHTSG